jgi:hypothetical protein
MLTIIVNEEEVFDERTSTFETLKGATIHLEHSLISLSKWESKYQKPFLSAEEKTVEEIFGYIEAMVISEEVQTEILYRLSSSDITKIQQYIDSSQSATTFGMMPDRKGPQEVITSELIYYWMVAYTIPFECQYWHINRLFALIRICNIKNSPPEEVSRHEIAARNRELNEQRRKELGTSG